MGISGEFLVVSVFQEMKHDSARKVLKKFRENSGQDLGTKFGMKIRKFWELSFCNFSDLRNRSRRGRKLGLLQPQTGPRTRIFSGNEGFGVQKPISTRPGKGSVLSNKKLVSGMRAKVVKNRSNMISCVLGLFYPQTPKPSVDWAAANGGVTNRGIGLFLPFSPFPEGPHSTWKFQQTEGKDPFPQMSSDLPKPPSLKPPFAALQVDLLHVFGALGPLGCLCLLNTRRSAK